MVRAAHDKAKSRGELELDAMRRHGKHQLEAARKKARERQDLLCSSWAAWLMRGIFIRVAHAATRGMVRSWRESCVGERMETNTTVLLDLTHSMRVTSEALSKDDGERVSALGHLSSLLQDFLERRMRGVVRLWMSSMLVDHVATVLGGAPELEELIHPSEPSPLITHEDDTLPGKGLLEKVSSMKEELSEARGTNQLLLAQLSQMEDEYDSLGRITALCSTCSAAR